MTKFELETMLKEQGLKIEQLEQKLKSAEITKDHHYKQAESAKLDLENMHGLLDTFTNILPREQKEEGCNYSTVKYSPMTRLASWLVYVAHSKLTEKHIKG